jgi:osmotically-inducible protein OsmY
MKADNELRRDVEAELRWSPDLDEKDMSVKASGGVVTLTGFVGNYYEKGQAELATKRVAGVSGVANDIQVRSIYSGVVPDPEIARDAVAAIKMELPFAHERIKALVHEGRITLEGSVDWQYLRERTETAVRRVKGTLGVTNLIKVTPPVSATDIKLKIQDAFRRSAQIDANRITVEAHGGEVILKGEVRSWAECDEAQRTAWSAPGVSLVRNEISVSG